MGYTLDELLAETGVDEISGRGLSKKASAPESQNLSKLAERCRRAVEATPEEHVAANSQELVEKTAAVAIISRTLAEISAIDDASPGEVKTASAVPAPDNAEFIKAALEAGHSPASIASFLEKQAFGRIGRRVREFGAARKYKGALKADRLAAGKAQKSIREWEDVIRRHADAPASQKEALLSRVRRQMGDQEAMDLFSAMKGHTFKDLEGFKNLRKSVPAQAAGGPTPLAASMSVGGKQVGLTEQQMKKMKKPALYAGAGFAGAKLLSDRNKEPKRSGRGPVIITG